MELVTPTAPATRGVAAALRAPEKALLRENTEWHKMCAPKSAGHIAPTQWRMQRSVGLGV